MSAPAKTDVEGRLCRVRVVTGRNAKFEVEHGNTWVSAGTKAVRPRQATESLWWDHKVASLPRLDIRKELTLCHGYDGE